MEINIRKVFREKNSSLAKWVPGFLFSYLEKIIHQKEVNQFLFLHGDKVGKEFTDAAIEFFNVSIELNGLENIANHKRMNYVSNHPLGGFDGIILMSLLAQQFGEVKVLVNDILMNIKNLEPFFLPINKHGAQNKTAITAIEEAYASQIPVLSFPAGLCSRKIEGKIVDLEWKKNFISKSIETQRDIIPIHFEGRNSKFFYNLSNIRKKLGIKANIEMLYLVDELFRHRNGHFVINFGKPIPYTTFDKSRTQKEWAEFVKMQVYAMAKK